tara:strand:- start:4673 stop:5269 length:597 start_codon:yes stop_codon:yes gene_type:complete
MIKNKVIFLCIFFISIGICDDIWNKEIPPSYYLEVLSNQENIANKTAIKISEIIALVGFLSMLDYNGKYDFGKNYNQLFRPLLLLVGLGGITYFKKIINKNLGMASKAVIEINNIQNLIEKEKLAFMLLVDLAGQHSKDKNKNKSKKKEDNFYKYGRAGSGIIKQFSRLLNNSLKSNNPQHGMNIYEKALDNYLNQVK